MLMRRNIVIGNKFNAAEMLVTDLINFGFHSHPSISGSHAIAGSGLMNLYNKSLKADAINGAA